MADKTVCVGVIGLERLSRPVTRNLLTRGPSIVVVSSSSGSIDKTACEDAFAQATPAPAAIGQNLRLVGGSGAGTIVTLARVAASRW